MCIWLKTNVRYYFWNWVFLACKQTHTLVKGLGPWFPFVWIQCPDNRLHYSSIFRISADFTISPNHILSMCPMKQMLLLVGNASELLHMKIQRVRATIFFGQRRGGDHTFSFGIHTILAFTYIFDFNSCGFSLLGATFVTFSKRIFWGLNTFKQYVLLFWTKLFFITTKFFSCSIPQYYFLFRSTCFAYLYQIPHSLHNILSWSHFFSSKLSKPMESENHPKQNPSIWTLHFHFQHNTFLPCTDVLMLLKFSIPMLQHKHHMWVSCRINPQDAGNRTRRQLPNPSVILGMIPTHCKAQGKTFSYVDHKTQEAHKVPSKYTRRVSLSAFQNSNPSPWQFDISLSLVPNSYVFPGLKVHESQQWLIICGKTFSQSQKMMKNYGKYLNWNSWLISIWAEANRNRIDQVLLTPPPPNKIPHLTRWRIGFQRAIHQSLVVYSIL